MEELHTVRTRLIALCQEHAHVIEDYPFDDPNWTVMRHEGNRKSFAYIYERNGEIWLNVKNTPERNEYLRETIPEIMPAYHMNKTHWITLRLISEELYPIADRIITESYQLTQTKPRKKTAARIEENGL
ncbi:MmcQ/YjbR family DNA-binding protein [Trichococcus sp.]|uniref:MmcQ/YjbR family DNA-binding protein n=1 Tax=Trichococcus sp. TaxID=1985464 RepID=UPI003C7DBFD3